MDSLEAPVNTVCDFLVSLFEKGKQVSTIKNYSSAIASSCRFYGLLFRGLQPDNSYFSKTFANLHDILKVFQSLLHIFASQELASGQQVCNRKDVAIV